jgi:hypothetical protein
MSHATTFTGKEGGYFGRNIGTACRPAAAVTAEELFFISGLVWADGTITIDPVPKGEGIADQTNPPPGSAYCVVSQDYTGAPLATRCFDVDFQNPETLEASDVALFRVALPDDPRASRILVSQGGSVVAQIEKSLHVPNVKVLTPNGGESWPGSGLQEITWAGSDLDGDPLTYRVEYSPDGTRWRPVAAGTTETRLQVDAKYLPGGRNARIRVMANDGFNEANDQSNAGFIVAAKGPQAFILAPSSTQQIASGTRLWLEGSAIDLEDEELGDERLTWSSSRDGTLGSGRQIGVHLTWGAHTITLTATDSDGNRALATMSIFVGDRIYLPLMIR